MERVANTRDSSEVVKSEDSITGKGGLAGGQTDRWELVEQQTEYVGLPY